METDRVVPVIIFLRQARNAPRRLCLKGRLKSNLLIFNDKKQIFWWYNKCEHFYFGFQYDS